MDLGMTIIYLSIFVVCMLFIIGFIILCKSLPDVQNPFKKSLKKNNDISLNVVEAPRPQPKPVPKNTLKDAWNTISQEAKKELPTMKVEVPVSKPLQPMPVPVQKTQKPAKRKLSAAELMKRKISTKPGSLK